MIVSVGWSMAQASVDRPVNIWGDNREARSCGVAARLAEMEGARVTLKRLRSGDSIVEEKAVMERKRVPDFIESRLSGVLFL